MWMLVIAVSIANILFAAHGVCIPLLDHSPLIVHGWAQVVRLRHLYAVRTGLHLLISGDGQIQGSAEQNLHSLLEIRPVDRGCVVFRGVATARFLCIEGNGRLYSAHTYSRDDCTFREQLLPDGYNFYVSERHGALLSLEGHQHRRQSLEQGVPALSQFLPRTNTLDPVSSPGPAIHADLSATQTMEPVNPMDYFGRLSQFMQSPSFQER